MEMFESAVRNKLRFESEAGVLSVEDVWDLPLKAKRGVSLDTLSRALYRKVQEAKEVSFVEEQPVANQIAQLKFDVVKHIIDVKKAEHQACLSAAEKTAQKTRLLEVLARKQDAALEGHSVEELQEMIAAL